MNYFLHEIDDLFTENECRELIESANEIGWKHVNRGYMASYDRVILIHKPLSDFLLNKIKKYLPSHFNGKRIVGLNDYFRFSKYVEGEQFKIHRDGINTDKFGNRAVMTLNIFLNIPEEGGGTFFYEDNTRNLKLDVRPKMGRGALFNNQILHEGEIIKKGEKYLIRTDVMGADF